MEASGSCRSRELQARNYLKKHRIMELLNYLTSSLLFFQPDKPKDYLVSLLERLRIAKITGVAFPVFMDHSNIVSMFEMIDTSKKGTISFVQYKEALNTLGLCTPDEALKDDGHGITLDKFRNEVGEGREGEKYQVCGCVLCTSC
ncbi:EF-hand calcium-binding domain-containing protein 10 isoform X2 [Desmodus rotundus]|uniref:EF-hand calcium-binding domain-containing protein 10 isoform X2 n=1 Tax=Desmodus rotundus TaxID=9430 RepID=UPI0023815CD2|nr:EF-hand calcium-binding domain-containing protein 10 isoform X2 [Desmodus rotundus]